MISSKVSCIFQISVDRAGLVCLNCCFMPKSLLKQKGSVFRHLSEDNVPCIGGNGMQQSNLYQSEKLESFD